MSQITRCPSCATMFKFVAGQLQAAQGWVRCGQCGAVFEASLHLVSSSTGGADALPHALQDLADKTALPPEKVPLFPLPGHATGWPPESIKEPADGASAVAPMQPAASVSHDISRMPLPDEKPVTHALRTGSETVDLLAGSQGRHEPVFSAEGFNFKPFAATPHASGQDLQDSALRQDSREFPDVSFVREAQRENFWTSPLVRSVLCVICLVLALALVLQWAVRQKDALAAQAPRLAPWLQAMCRPLGCEVRPLLRIESLVIENASFSRTGPDAYRLNFTLKNTGDANLEIPALEVTLTDSHDQAVVRRVVMPAEFGATATTLAAYSKLAGALILTVDGAGGQGPAPAVQTGFLPVAGYRILAFYP
ncbi:Probable transmembrane protein [Polaromonas sp. CG9_12]|nr:Probable transmembrane protein [Polaromonas sp. CG9_12]